MSPPAKAGNKTPSRQHWDCLVIGAGPAGLAAATYLGRYRRSVCVVHSGSSRASYIRASHNVPGFPDGVSGRKLLQLMRRQATTAGAAMEELRVDRIEGKAGHFIVCAGRRRLHASTVLLATGAADFGAPARLSPAATLRGIVRWCPVCDGYESLDQRVVLIGEPQHGTAHALFLRTYTRDLVLVIPPGEGRLPPTQRRKLAGLDVRVVHAMPTRATFGVHGGGELHLEGGDSLPFDVLYPMTGGQARSELALAMGAYCGRHGAPRVDAHMRTTVPGLYAAGDVLPSLKQIALAVAEAATAATAIHVSLPRNYR